MCRGENHNNCYLKQCFLTIGENIHPKPMIDSFFKIKFLSGSMNEPWLKFYKSLLNELEIIVSR